MHPMNWVSMSPVFYFGKDSVKAKFSRHKRELPLTTKIGHDVWIGQNVLIKQGVTIGTGAVIGMGSVVTKNVEPYTIVVGNPAKCIRKRFDDDTITKIIESKWWLFDEKRLIECAEYFANPKDFINYLEL